MNKSPRVLFVDKPHSIITEQLTAAGVTCEYIPELNKAQTESIIRQFNGLVIRSRFSIDKSFINQAQHLLFIGREGAGMDNIDVAYAESLGIRCLNSPEGNRDAVGEHTVGMLLALLNKLVLADLSVRKGIWDREGHRGIELQGKTVGIIGYGNMGSAFAQRLKGFNVQVIAYDKYKIGFSDEIVKEVTLNELFHLADVVSLHVPLTAETHNMASKSFFDNFSKQIIILNTSRGKVLNTEDLVNAMKADKVFGACLDVLDYENSSQQINLDEKDVTLNYLFGSERVVLSPHVAGWTKESKEKLSLFLGDKIIALLKQKKLL